MENLIIKMDAIVNNPNLPVLSNSVEFLLKNPNSASYPIAIGPINGNGIKNCKLETKSGNNIFSTDGVTYTNEISAASFLNIKYIQLTQDEEIIATMLDVSAPSEFSFQNFTTNLAMEIKLESLMYFETFGIPTGAGSKIVGNATDLWNPKFMVLNVFAQNVFQENIDVSDFIRFNNGTLSSWMVKTTKITFDFKAIDDNPLLEGHHFSNMSSVGVAQMVYSGQPTDTITWTADMHYIGFKDVVSARNWFLALANSPNAIAGLKNVRLAATNFVWDEECLAAKTTIINTLTQEYINTCTNFTVFGQNWKQ